MKKQRNLLSECYVINKHFFCKPNRYSQKMLSIVLAFCLDGSVRRLESIRL